MINRSNSCPIILIRFFRKYKDVKNPGLRDKEILNIVTSGPGLMNKRSS